MCGFSGLPKFRQLVSPSGAAPTHARLAAHSSTASTVPVYGSAATRRPLPSIETPIDAPLSRTSTAASACSGRRTVREPTMQSYCSKQRPARRQVRRADQREQRVVTGVQRRRRRRVDRRRRWRGRQVVQRAVVDQRRHGDVADQLIATEDPHPPRVGHLADDRPADLPLLAHRQHRGRVVGRADAQHPLLRFGDHDLERLHVAFAQRDPRDVDVDPDLAGARHLRGG